MKHCKHAHIEDLLRSCIARSTFQMKNSLIFIFESSVVETQFEAAYQC